MILGIGSDVLEIEHFKKALAKTPLLIDRVFTLKEQKAAKKLSKSRQIAFYAKRFSAKESIAKACGTGIGKEIGWLDIDISNTKEGSPIVLLSKKATLNLKKRFKTDHFRFFVSLSDEKTLVFSVAILESTP